MLVLEIFFIFLKPLYILILEVQVTKLSLGQIKNIYFNTPFLT